MNMKKILAASLTGAMLVTSAIPVMAEEAATVTSSDVYLTANDTYYVMENPILGETDDNEVVIEYTINFDAMAAKNGWDGIFSFFGKDDLGSRVSFQTAPYVCYNECKPEGVENKWADIKSDAFCSNNCEPGTDYTFKYVITPDSIEATMNGEPVEGFGMVGSSGSETPYQDILDGLHSYEKFTVGVGQAVSSFWFTELCKLSDVNIDGHKLISIGKEGSAPTCTTGGKVSYKFEDVDKTYDETEVNALGHAYNWVVKTTKATPDKDGAIVESWECVRCGELDPEMGESVETTVISKPVVTLSEENYTENGNVQAPKVTVKDSKGAAIDASEYKVTYQNASSKAAGKYSVTVDFIGEKYTGKVTKTYTIAAKKVTLKTQKITVKKAKATFKVAQLKKKKQTFSIGAKASTNVTYKVTKKDAKKVLSVSNSGKVTVKKGAKKGTYSVTVKISAPKSATYKAATKTVKITVTVKK